VVDASTALLLAYSAMVALFHRERTGEGQKVEVNLFATAVALQCQEFTAFLNSDGGFERSEAGIGGAWLAAPFGIYRTADGWIALSMISLATLGEVLGMPELAAYEGDGPAFRDRDEVKRLLEPVIARPRPRTGWRCSARATCGVRRCRTSLTWNTTRRWSTRD